AATINAGGFYLFKVPSGLVSDIADRLVLRDATGMAISQTPFLIDRAHDDRTWQRVPDGSDQWRFQNQTQMRPNDPTTFMNSTSTAKQDSRLGRDNSSAYCTGNAGCVE